MDLDIIINLWNYYRNLYHKCIHHLQKFSPTLFIIFILMWLEPFT